MFLFTTLWVLFVFSASVSLRQLEETVAALRAKEEAAARLKRGQAEAQKRAQGLEVSLREAAEKRSQLESDRAELEKRLHELQEELDEERRDRHLKADTITEQQSQSSFLAFFLSCLLSFSLAFCVVSLEATDTVDRWPKHQKMLQAHSTCKVQYSFPKYWRNAL